MTNIRWFEYIRPKIIKKLDPEIINILDELNEAGEPTTCSCAGHGKYDTGSIEFELKEPMDKIIRPILKKHHLKNIHRECYFNDFDNRDYVVYDFDPIEKKE